MTEWQIQLAFFGPVVILGITVLIVIHFWDGLYK
jgi:hypothetical protein